MDEPDNGEGQTNDAQPVHRGRPKGSKNKPKLINLDETNNKLSANADSLIQSKLDHYIKKYDLETRREQYNTLINGIHEDLTTAKHALFAMSEKLNIIHRSNLYYLGGYTSFGDFLKAEIGSRSRGYELLHAQEVLEHLLEGGFQLDELPKTEILCRKIRQLPLDIQGKVWKIVDKNAAKSGTDPTAEDIFDAAEKVASGGEEDDDDPDDEGTPTEEERKELEKQLREEHQAKVLSEVKSAGKKLTFNLTVETLTDDFRRRLTAELMAIAVRATELLKIVKFDEQAKAVPEAAPLKQDEHQQHEAARAIVEEKEKEADEEV